MLLQFFISKGLVANAMLEKYSMAYTVLTGMAIASQFAMVRQLFKQNPKHFGAG